MKTDNAKEATLSPNLYVFRIQDYFYIRATVPKENGKTLSKAFSFTQGDDESLQCAEKAACDWRDQIGELEWGKTRFSMYTSGLITSRQLKMVHRGVNCRKSKARGIDTYNQWIVEWAEFNPTLGRKQQKSKIFTISKYGALGFAAHEASLFAAKTRARLMASELHLPNFTFDLSEIHAQYTENTHS